MGLTMGKLSTGLTTEQFSNQMGTFDMLGRSVAICSSSCI